MSGWWSSPNDSEDVHGLQHITDAIEVAIRLRVGGRVVPVVSELSVGSPILAIEESAPVVSDDGWRRVVLLAIVEAPTPVVGDDDPNDRSQGGRTLADALGKWSTLSGVVGRSRDAEGDGPIRWVGCCSLPKSRSTRASASSNLLLIS